MISTEYEIISFSARRTSKCSHGRYGAPGRTIEALKKAIPLLKAQGYEFRRIEEKYGTAGKSEID